MKFVSKVFACLPWILTLVAIYLIYVQLKGVDAELFKREMKLWHFSDFTFALGLTFFSYFILFLYDKVGLKHLGPKLPSGQIAKTSFAAFSISNIVGHSVFSGSSIRLHTYGEKGVSLSTIAQLALLNSLNFWLGYSLLFSLCLIFMPLPLPQSLSPALKVLGPGFGILLLLGICGGYGSACRKWAGRILRVKRLEFKVPNTKTAFHQLLLGSLDVLLVGSVLYALLPDAMRLSFLPFMSFYLLAQLLGVLSQVPGGLGVLDGLLLKLLSPYADPHQLVFSLILFRLVYYVLPLALTVGVFLLTALYRQAMARWART